MALSIVGCYSPRAIRLFEASRINLPLLFLVELYLLKLPYQELKKQ
jgi:hypothetical protein